MRKILCLFLGHDRIEQDELPDVRYEQTYSLPPFVKVVRVPWECRRCGDWGVIQRRVLPSGRNIDTETVEEL